MNGTLILKTLRDRWRSSLAWAAAMTALITVQLYIYPSVEESGSAMDQFIAAFPPEFIAMFRIEDYTSGIGFLGTELFSMMIPLVFIALGAAWGASASAEEEERGTSEVLYTLPIRRGAVQLSKIVAFIVVATVVGIWVIAVISIGAPVVDLDITDANIIPVTIACVMLGVFFHAISLATGALTGRRSIAIGASIGLALLSFLVFALAPMVDSFDAIIQADPFQWALGENPLANGFDWLGLAWLGFGALVSYAIALIAINRRDIAS